MSVSSSQRSIKMAWKLGLFAVIMFGFAVWFMPILYGLICDLTGLGSPNAKTAAQEPETANPNNPYLVNESSIKTPENDATVRHQPIRVLFSTRNVGGITWMFEPEQKSIVVNPGKRTTVYFLAKNTTNRDMIAQSIPSFTPAFVSPHFKKFECFCFSQQSLKAGESDRMAMTFYIEPSISSDITEITLNYQLFDITDRVAQASSDQGGES